MKRAALPVRPAEEIARPMPLAVAAQVAGG
mgnify:CR=1 FL=1